MTNVNSISELLKSFEAYMDGIHWAKEPIGLYEPVNYILSIGGKRIRPLSVIYLVAILNGDKTKALHAAYGIELFHNFSLMHDDIMDHSFTRRKQDTVHIKYSVNQAILSGDLMLIESLNYIQKAESESNKGRLVQNFLETARQVCEGQSLDMSFETKTDVNLADYLEMIRLKTAVLLANSFGLAAQLSDRSDLYEGFYQLGIEIGIVFQLEDDWLDYYSENYEFGKQKAGDILRSKKSALVLELCENLDPRTRNEFLKWYQSESNPEIRLEKIDLLFKQFNIKETLKQRIASHKIKAQEGLDRLNLSEDQKRAIEKWMQLILERSY